MAAINSNIATILDNVTFSQASRIASSSYTDLVGELSLALLRLSELLVVLNTIMKQLPASDAGALSVANVSNVLNAPLPFASFANAQNSYMVEILF